MIAYPTITKIAISVAAFINDFLTTLAVDSISQLGPEKCEKHLQTACV